MTDSLSDEELAGLVQKGDQNGFVVLMDRYTAKLLRYGRRLLPGENNIGDTVQDIFVTVYQNIQNFDLSRKFSPWIYRIAHNAFVDIVRRKAKEPFYVFDLDRIVPHPAYEDPLAREKERREIGVLLERGLAKLSPAYREVIDLYYFEDFSYREIGDILHLPIGTVGIRLSRAREALKKQLPEYEDE